MKNNHLAFKEDNHNYHNIENELYLKDYFLLLRIHLRKLIYCVILFLLIGFYTTINKTPMYSSKGTMIVRVSPGANTVADITKQKNNNQIRNKIELLRSRTLAEDVVRSFYDSKRRNNLFLFGTRKYYPKGQRIRTLFKEIFTLGLYDAQDALKVSTLEGPLTYERLDDFSKRIKNHLTVKHIPNTNLIEVSYRSKNADEARRIVNRTMGIFSVKDKEWSNQYALNSVSFLDSLVNVQEKILQNTDSLKMDFLLENKLHSMEAKSDDIIKRINGYEGELYNIKTQKSINKQKIEFLSSKLSSEEKDLADKIVGNINIQLSALRDEAAKLESQIITNSSIYGETHEFVQDLKKKLNNLTVAIDERVTKLALKGIAPQDPLRERQEIISEILNLENNIYYLNITENETQKELDRFNEKLRSIPETKMQMDRFERQEMILRDYYLALINKLEETKLNNAILVGDVRIVDLAKLPKIPYSPNHQKDILMFLFFGIAIGLFIIFVIEVLDSSIKTIDEIEKYDKNVIGVIPAIGKMKSQNFIMRYFDDKTVNILGGEKGIKRKIITKDNPKSPISESYRGLRTNILLSNDKEIKSMLVSSAGPGEGKTTTVANLAITFANLGKKTLLVDTDLRRPVIHSVFELKRDPGVTTFLSGQTDDYKTLLQAGEVDNLFIMTSGIIPPNPSELLGSKRMIHLVRELEDDFDMVLFDSPPLVAVTDANMISREIDRILLVIKAGQTDKKAFHHTMMNLKNINAPLEGIVMNAVTSKSNYGSYYYYYYHQYYHYYSSSEDDEK
ncbi:MAG: hypothetical protein CMG55_08775 [Candidatus Marinimicrobia bacterium]|nr:hypothetical protein [Candidatus Neomarinimicrobiota bacterium]